MELAKKDNAGNSYVEVNHMRITHVASTNREEAKNWSGQDVLRFQAYVDQNKDNRLHKGAEFPVSDNGFMDLIGELCLLRKAVNKET